MALVLRWAAALRAPSSTGGAALAAVDSRGVELGDDRVVATVFHFEASNAPCAGRVWHRVPRRPSTHLPLSVFDDVYALADALQPQRMNNETTFSGCSAL
jgi:hypothetical protein